MKKILGIFFIISTLLSSPLGAEAQTLRPAAQSDQCLWTSGEEDPPLSSIDQTVQGECSANVWATATTSIWSGYMVTAGYNKYSGVTGRLVVPARSNFCSGSSYAGWIGIGGYNTTSLLQIGLMYTPGSSTARFFYEYLGVNTAYPAVFPSGVTFTAGSTVDLKMTYDPSTRKFSMTAGLVGDTTPFTKTVTLPSGDDFYDGTTAEWVDERLTVYDVPSGQFSVTSLMKFGSISWANAKGLTSSGTWETISGGTETPVVMYSYPNVLAQPVNGLTSSTSFSDYWFACDGWY